ncbi:Ubiquitin-like modifier-activating enzyme 1 [Varanus komodoensis]|nr:Ubiquitin-like modifier-activating enzyme 1 [Varanus komodoensis]
MLLGFTFVARREGGRVLGFDGSRMSTSKSSPKIDEELYSRQLYTLDHKAMQKMSMADVLVSGMKGLGVEIAKNIILAGVNSVTLHDQDNVKWSDLSSQFYLSENVVGKNRAEVSRHHLANLNSNVSVKVAVEELTESFLSSFKVVVLTNSTLEEQLNVNDFCHANNICFVLADTKGLAAQLFCDFGERFIVCDPSEAEPFSAEIQHITQGNPGILTVARDDEREFGNYFMDGDYVTFSQVKGMTELNGAEPRPIQTKDGFTLEIGDTSSFSPYQSGGIVTQVKMPQKYSFKSLCASLGDPKIQTSARSLLPRYYTLHAAFRALNIFQNNDLDRMVRLAEILRVSEEPLQEDLVRTFVSSCTGDLSPVNAFIGGLAAQEVLKAASQKFTPLNQWLYFDAFECLPQEEQLTAEDCAPRNSRYDGQIAVFGANFQEQLGKQKYFVVGAGAIGCELLKNFAMIGLAAGQGGSITVTDMDTIARSNLNRQFLFQERHVSKLKSEVAAAAIKGMNPNLNVIAEQNQVGPETEHIYGDDFFLGLDGVVSAVDNWQARNYIGKRCMQFHKPLLDSGTNGTKGHVEVLIPHLTQPYSKVLDIDEREYPHCTLRYFPSTIQHTIQWARDQFEGLFKTAAENVNKFLNDPSFLENKKVEGLEIMEQVKIRLQEKPQNERDCVIWARNLWERLFSHDIQQLLHNLPLDYETSSGHPFWSKPKRCPHQLDFDYNNTTHLTFIRTASILFGQTYKFHMKEDEAAAIQILCDMHLPSFQPHQGVFIPVTDEEMQKHSGGSVKDQMRLAKLKQELAELKQKLEKDGACISSLMEPVHFEKVNTCQYVSLLLCVSLHWSVPKKEESDLSRRQDSAIPTMTSLLAALPRLLNPGSFQMIHRHISPLLQYL